MVDAAAHLREDPDIAVEAGAVVEVADVHQDLPAVLPDLVAAVAQVEAAAAQDVKFVKALNSAGKVLLRALFYGEHYETNVSIRWNNFIFCACCFTC